jgi:hypothetical protein
MRRRASIVSTVLLFALAISGCGQSPQSTGAEQAPAASTDSSPSQVSAKRSPDEDFTTAARRELPRHDGRPAPGEIYAGSVAFDLIDTSAVPSFTRADLDRAFAFVRDQRRISWKTPDGADFARRLTWLYPDDFCFARAEAMSQWVEGQLSLPRLPKVWIFGNLRVETANHPSGAVTWWYHVAPIAKVDGQVYVFDPAIEPREPLPLQTWAGKQTPLSNATFNVCTPHGFFPQDTCDAAPRSDAQSLVTSYFGVGTEVLGLEWDRQKELGRDPVSVLGDSPPWAAP